MSENLEKENFRKEIRNVFNKEKGNITEHLLKKIKEETGAETIDEIADDFYSFCGNLHKDKK